ncbi:hypothetical protein AJ79_05267 [Helicocarpus griseus UAMH5409]|uniref:Uncharacterized protein n=1 Tax=Helicocarpus griseus UAMH5409 TaxID=1447875 RepID=A0A2B7XGE3_9EURO|nr:hypothetical protein AJ79_05267 [Helicocarpus griseus UAMH5409]
MDRNAYLTGITALEESGTYIHVFLHTNRWRFVQLSGSTPQSILEPCFGQNVYVSPRTAESYVNAAGKSEMIPVDNPRVTRFNVYLQSKLVVDIGHRTNNPWFEFVERLEQASGPPLLVSDQHASRLNVGALSAELQPSPYSA